MKLHPITWILLGVACVQLAALSVLLAEAVSFFETARRSMIGHATEPLLQTFFSQWLGSLLQGVGRMTASASLAVWVEVLSRIYNRLSVESAQG